MEYYLSIHKVTNYSCCGLASFSEHEIQLTDKADFEYAKELCDNTQNMASIWKQVFIPIRTNQTSDVFLPILMNTVLKVENFSRNALLIIAALAIDLMTLPIRLFFFLPQMGYNRFFVKPVEHPLIGYLKDKNFYPEKGKLDGITSHQWHHRYHPKSNRWTEEKTSLPNETYGPVNIRLYTKKNEDLVQIEEIERIYQLYLTDHEVPFTPNQPTSVSYRIKKTPPPPPNAEQH